MNMMRRSCLYGDDFTIKPYGGKKRGVIPFLSVNPVNPNALTLSHSCLAVSLSSASCIRVEGKRRERILG